MNYIKENITTTLEKNYMPYAMSVIISRAIPEIDGFKPAHRKLLYTMYKMGLLGINRTKSTNVVGQTMKLNPHGDMAIYETLVRLTKGNDALLAPFIDSKGNFGKQYSRDMAFAASRYTEVKLHSICEQIFKNIDKDTVDFIDNYDGTVKEPILLPTTFPNILVTNNQGIAVSMASSICSFNLKEICETTIKYIKKENIDIKKYLKAPDFSTGGEIVYNEKDIENIYKTGRGSFKLRGKYKYDEKNHIIEIYEIPYTTTIEAIIDKIIILVRQNKIKDISDVRNETDKNGLKIAIDVKKSTNVDLLMYKIYSMTTFSDTFSCNFNILIDSTPKVIGIREILFNWLDFRMKCIKRQTLFDLQKKKEKHHLLEGLAKIAINIDKVIAIIRDTKKEIEVIPNLKKYFNIDDLQAEYIAEIKLRNLNDEYLLKRTNEKKILEDEINSLNNIYKDENLIKDIICSQLKDVMKKYGKPRKTKIVCSEEIENISKEELIEDYQVKFFMTNEMYLKKVSRISLRSSGEHKLKEGDFITKELDSTNKSILIFFTNKKNVYKIKASDIQDVKVSSMGYFLSNIIGLEEDEEVIYLTQTTDYKEKVIFVYEDGKIAKIPLDLYETKTNRKKLTKAYNDKAKLIYIESMEKEKDIILIRNDNKVVLINTKLIELKDIKTTKGTQIIKLKKDSLLTAVINKNNFKSDDIEYYRASNINALGHFLKVNDEYKA